MKPYFAKLLPTEGDSNYVLCHGKHVVKRLDDNRNLYNYEGSEEPPITKSDVKMFPDSFKHVKLFLCSRDIQVGDFITWQPNQKGYQDDIEGLFKATEGDVRMNKKNKKGYGKAIGEISHNSRWVKEGDEFEEDEVHIYYKFVKKGGIKVCSTKSPIDRIEFRCPTCKTFH